MQASKSKDNLKSKEISRDSLVDAETISLDDTANSRNEVKHQILA